jgi:cysteinyl-tRNA synthetase
MQIFNTLTKQLATVQQKNEHSLGMYSCGPTVYEHAHIGNLAAFIYADTIRRVLTQAGKKVIHVMNITDVDDKTIARSARDNHNLEPMAALLALTSKLTTAFMNDMTAVGNDVQALTIVKATDHIEDMQQIITALVDKGIGYIADDGIYFSIDAYQKAGYHYGQLSHIAPSAHSEARINNDEYDKVNAHDFALWKKRRDDEPYWHYVINDQVMDGRPGWHIECSAMSTQLLDQPLAIHTGGIDLIFPHHENELAQTKAYTGQELADIFVHSEHLLVDGKKMSKSLGNYLTLKDITAKGFDPLAFRILVLRSHYRSQSNFTWEGLEAAQQNLKDIRAWSDLRFQNVTAAALIDSNTTLTKKLQTQLEHNLATPEAFATLLDIVKQSADHADARAVADVLPAIEALFGLDLLDRQDINSTQKQLLAERHQARLSNNWNRSDQIRAQLYDQELVIKDTTQGQIWERLS